MTGQNDRQERSLTGQVRDQAGHCPVTGRYLQPYKGGGGKGRYADNKDFKIQRRDRNENV